MALPLTKKNTNYIIDIVQDYMRCGKSLNAFLTDFYLSNREWKKFLRKNRKLKRALKDGEIYFRAYWEKEGAKAIYRKRGNTQILKMALENNLGWSVSGKREEETVNPRKMYKVYLDLGPEEGNEDKIVPDKKEEKKDEHTKN